MPKRIIQLSDTKVRNAKPRKNEYKLFDGAGLFLSVTPSGGKLWYLKYRFDGKEKKLSLGSYPEIDLATARTRKEEARRQVANGVDPGEVRKAMKQAEAAEAETFEVIAREWHRKFKPTWTPSHAVMILGRLESMTCFHIWESDQSTRSKPRSFWRSFAGQKAEALYIRRIASGPLPARFSVTRSPRAGQNAIVPEI